jgi:hypothetical protein
MQTKQSEPQTDNLMVQDFANWVKNTQKDATGSTLAHACASTNSFELVVLILKQNPKLLNELDNYGRSPLSWAFFAGATKTACYLMSLGAKLYQPDDVLDTPLHIAAKQNRLDELRNILFWAMKNDDESKTQARIILHTLNLKNKEQETPIDIAIRMKNLDLAHLLRGIESICQDHIKQVEKYIFFQDITMRSGPFNGHNLSKIDLTITGVRLEFMQDHVILLCYKKTGQNLKVVIKMEQFAFLILEKVQQRAELTLSSAPEVFSWQNDEWKPIQTSIFNSGLSFHCIVKSVDDLTAISGHVSKNLSEFQQGCFCMKSSEKKSLPTNQNVSKSKIGILRQKMSHMNALSTQKTKQEDIKTDFNLQSFQ